MAIMDYVEIPTVAARLGTMDLDGLHSSNTPAKVITNLPNPEKTPLSSPIGLPPTPTKAAGFSFQQALLSSTLALPANAPSTPRSSGKGGPRLLSSRDPLSIPISTANFRRFVSRVGPVFWLQDRLEEIILWKKGWKYTSVWIALYAFLCYFPHLMLFVPILLALSVMLSTATLENQTVNVGTAAPAVPPLSPLQIGEGSAEWFGNIQAIQNLMGFIADTEERVLPAISHITHQSPYTPIILTLTLVMMGLAIPLSSHLPLRPTLLLVGLIPFFFNHPYTQETLLPLVSIVFQPYIKPLRTRISRLVDDDRLEDKHWRSELREVELWENERWVPVVSGSNAVGTKEADSGWSKVNLKPQERKAWTRGRDGWSAIADDGSGDVSSNLTFSLSPGWLFVETEDWRADYDGCWLPDIGADDNGWVYSNDTWMAPHPAPLDEWKTAGAMTRRRRWARRIYYQPS